MIIHVDPACAYPYAFERRNEPPGAQAMRQHIDARMAEAMDRLAAHLDRSLAERDDVSDAGTVVPGRPHCGRDGVVIRKHYDGLVYWPSAYVTVRLTGAGRPETETETGPLSFTGAQCLELLLCNGGGSGSGGGGSQQQSPELCQAVRRALGDDGDPYERALRVLSADADATTKQAGLHRAAHASLGLHLIEAGLQAAIPGFVALGPSDLMFRLPQASAERPGRLRDVMSAVDRVFDLLGRPAAGFAGTARVYLVPGFHKRLVALLVRGARRPARLLSAVEGLGEEAAARAARWLSDPNEYLSLHADTLAPLFEGTDEDHSSDDSA